ncbi:MAG: hypothetical protein R3F13_09860 [Prosthecobacter sp.]
MTKTTTLLLALLSLAGFTQAAPLVYEGTDGPGKGKHIVFLAGDHEYRSEETLPALARILAKHQGFRCTVLFDIDPDGNIAAGEPQNIPGMEALDSADLAVVFLRFQGLPPEQMKHFDDYLKRGGPVVGLRTATHAFKGTPEPYSSMITTPRSPVTNSASVIRCSGRPGWGTTAKITCRALASPSCLRRHRTRFCAV